MRQPGSLTPLLECPPFQGVDAAVQQEILRLIRRQHIHAGAVIVDEGEQATDLVILLEGEVSVYQTGKLSRVARAPEALGLLSVLERGRRSATLRAFQTCEVARLDRDELWRLIQRYPQLGASVILHLGEEIRRLYAREERWLSHLEDFYESPAARMVPGPYRAEPYEMIFLVMRGDPAALASLRPPGLRAIPGMEDVYVLTFNFFERIVTAHPSGQGKSFSYSETTPFLPCLGRGPGLFSPELYPDSYLAISIGRELYGLPKRFGLTERRGREVELSVDQRLILRTRWDSEAPCEVDAFTRDVATAVGAPESLAWLAASVNRGLHALAQRREQGRLPISLPLWVRQQVPQVSLDQPGAWASDRLLEVPFSISGIQDLARLAAPHVHQLDDRHFRHGRCLCGYRMRVAFGFDRVTTRRDYLAEERGRSRLVRLLEVVRGGAR